MRPPADGAARKVVLDGVAFEPWTEAGTARSVAAALGRGQGGLLVTANVDILRILRRPEGREIAERADVIVADGLPVVWASRLAGTPLPERVPGSSLVDTLADELARSGRSLYLLGGPPGAAVAAAAELSRRHPGLMLAGTSCPAMGFEGDPVRWQQVVEDVVAASPDVVYVALGAPKQERVGIRLADLLPATWFLGCGASVAFLAGMAPRAPHWMQRAGLEWLHRLVAEPRRLWRRYLVYDLPYVLGLFTRAWLSRIGVWS